MWGVLHGSRGLPAPPVAPLSPWLYINTPERECQYFFSSFLEKFLDCLPHHPQRLRNPVAVLPTYIPRNEVARGTVRFLCGGSYMALVGFRLHRLPPSHRGYILTHPLGNVNTFFQVSLKSFWLRPAVPRPVYSRA